MKLSIGMLSILFVSSMFAQPHILPCTLDHTKSRCTGWATGRSFKKYYGDAVCNPATLWQGTMNPAYFEWVPETNMIILNGQNIFGWGSNGTDHVAWNERGGRFSQVRWEGAVADTDLTLATINTQQGSNPTGYWREIGTRTRDITARNTFGDDSHGGSVIWDGDSEHPQSSPHSFAKDHATQHSLTRVTGQLSAQNIKQVFLRWDKDQSSYITDQTATFWVENNSMFSAVHNNVYDVAFSYSKPTGTFSGTIVVNGQSQSTPTSAVEVVQYQNISASATTYFVSENVQFTFASWSPGGSTNPNQSFSPSGSSQLYSVTANFNPKPLPPANLYVGGTAGNPVQLSWTSHSSTSGVTEYQIWRKVKPKNQNEQSPELLATVGRTTTSYVDYDFVITSSYTDFLLSYDVRARYNAGGASVYADPNYGAVFGEWGAKALRSKIAQSIEAVKSYSLTVGPNPFNPSTSVRYAIPIASLVRLEVFDASGRKMSTLVDGETQPGLYSAYWNGIGSLGTTVSSGVYFCRMLAVPVDGSKPYVSSVKLVMLK